MDEFSKDQLAKRGNSRSMTCPICNDFFYSQQGKVKFCGCDTLRKIKKKLEKNIIYLPDVYRRRRCNVCPQEFN